jgi:hypothetical protein
MNYYLNIPTYYCSYNAYAYDSLQSIKINISTNYLEPVKLSEEPYISVRRLAEKQVELHALYKTQMVQICEASLKLEHTVLSISETLRNLTVELIKLNPNNDYSERLAERLSQIEDKLSRLITALPSVRKIR